MFVDMGMYVSGNRRLPNT